MTNFDRASFHDDDKDGADITEYKEEDDVGGLE